MLNQDGPVVLFDMSNVCRDRDLCTGGKRADLSAFARIHRALSRSPWTLGKVRGIADRNLSYFFDDADKARYKSLIDAGLVVEAPMADEPLFEYAFGETSAIRGALIVSMDNFADFRVHYPEIQGSTDRFIGWRVHPKGGVVVFMRDMGNFTHGRISRKVEEGEFKARKILHTMVRDRATNFSYRCPNPVCEVARSWPDRLHEIPVYDRRTDSFCCPGCGGRLEYVGTRAPSAQVIVFHGGKERRRILLEDGDSVLFGRRDRPRTTLGPGPDVPSDVAAKISREHLRLSMNGEALVAKDLGSKNGTVVEDRRGGRSRRMESGEEIPLGPRIRLRLPGDVLLERSGRQNPFAGEKLIDLALDADQSRVDATIAQL